MLKRNTGPIQVFEKLFTWKPALGRLLSRGDVVHESLHLAVSLSTHMLGDT